jgi:hypothetical protein
MAEFKGRFTKIKELSDRRRMPRLGKLRLGVKVVSPRTGKEYPKETEYFVVPPEVAKVYGDRPSELDVMLPINDIEAVFPQAYKWYGESKGLKCIGNGETAMRLNEKTQTMEERDCPCELLETNGCARRAHLLVILPGINMGGVYQIDIGSYHSIVDINSGLDFVQALVGRFAMVPLKLKRVPKETNANGQRQVHHTLQVILDADVNMINTLRENTSRVLLSTRNIALPAPEDINPAFDEGAVVVSDEEETKTDLKDRIPQATADVSPSGKSLTDEEKPKISQQQNMAIRKIASKAGIHKKSIDRVTDGMSIEQAADLIKTMQKGDFSAFGVTNGNGIPENISMEEEF